MREYRTSKELYQSSKSVEGEENLLEKVLGDAKPVVSSTVDSKYDIASILALLSPKYLNILFISPFET